MQRIIPYKTHLTVLVLAYLGYRAGVALFSKNTDDIEHNMTSVHKRLAYALFWPLSTLIAKYLPKKRLETKTKVI